MPAPGNRFRSAADRCGELLVRLCGRDFPQEGSAGAIASALADEEGRRLLLAAAANHRVLGLSLCAVLAARQQLAITRPVEAELSARLRERRRRAAMFELKRDRVVRLLQDGKIEFLLLKGAVLSGTVYADPVEREVEDLDLLVRSEDAEHTVEFLTAHGYAEPHSAALAEAYRGRHFHLPLRHADSHLVEIHWSLAAPRSPFQLDPRAVMECSIRVDLASLPAQRAPCAEHMVLHLVLQNVQEGFSRLARLTDIDRIVASNRDIRWDRLCAAAVSGGLSYPTALSLQLARRFFGSEIPGEVVRELRPPPVSRFHLAIMRPERILLRQRLPGRFAPTIIHDFWLLQGTRQRALQFLRGLGVRTETVGLRRKRRGVLFPFFASLKLLGMQVLFYLGAVLASASLAGRDQMRFWSSQAKSSERL